MSPKKKRENRSDVQITVPPCCRLRSMGGGPPASGYTVFPELGLILADNQMGNALELLESIG